MISRPPSSRTCLSCNKAFFFRCSCGKRVVSPEEKDLFLYDIQEAVLDLAAYFRMIDVQPLIDEIELGKGHSRFGTAYRMFALENLCVAIKAAGVAAEEFRKADLEEKEAAIRTPVKRRGKCKG